ncbi:hypothetical protein DQQ10_24335 [Pseudochryseolinea flava]|uniref:Uncharacterized protein n=2 Tax=Pseudochryseolinea flava TaxID=2059302 RepID=A0A364XXY2_9BACT|nr:hypothetical protein DQQ10_24335 [Pseudochryseolinea flava]
MLPIGVALLVAACDVFNDDVKPSKPVIENEVHVLKHTSAYIDFKSLLNTNGEIQVAISKAPQKGILTNVAPGLLKYSPNHNFTHGHDVFKYDIFDASHALLKSDSVIIIVEDDTTNLPCGLYAHDDVVTATSSPVAIEVWKNDIICGDTTDLKIEVFRPNHTFPPHQGTAAISGGHILYETELTTSVADTIIYRISRISNPSVYAYASVHVLINPDACNFTLFDDQFSFDRPVGQDTVTLPVTLNDLLCESVISFTIEEEPHLGEYLIGQNAELGYYVKYHYDLPGPDTVVFDSLLYKVCVPGQCKTGRARFAIF